MTRSHLILATLIFLGAVLRIAILADSNIMSERQFRSALLAREKFLSSLPSTPEWQLRVAGKSADRMGTLEPPVMEQLSVIVYRIMGHETILIPRFIATLFWLSGGYLLFLLAKELTDSASALYAVAYFLFLPLGMQISTAFLPDSLMLFLFTASLFALVRYHRNPSTSGLFIAGLLAAACVLVKPICLFGLLMASMSLQVFMHGWKRPIGRDVFVFCVLAVAPAVTYYAYGMIGSGFLQRQAGASFMPQLLLDPTYYRLTLRTAFDALGALPIALAAVGFVIDRDRFYRPLILGLIAGYCILCIVFTYHVRIAGHYHLQLAVPISICLGTAVSLLIGKVDELSSDSMIRRAGLVTAASIVAVFILMSSRQASRSTGPAVDPEMAREIGDAINHSDRVVYVSQYYGVPLEYFGQLSGWYWPRAQSDADRAEYGSAARERSIEERLRNLGSAVGVADEDFEPEYFVITDFREFQHHQDLELYLSRNCREMVTGKPYLIYGDCRAVD